MIINLPDKLVEQLQSIAQQEQRSVEDVVVEMVSAQIKQSPIAQSEIVQGFDIDDFLKVLDEAMEGLELPDDDVMEVAINSRAILHKIMGEQLAHELEDIE
jgi:predicted transcriptional regulator